MLPIIGGIFFYLRPFWAFYAIKMNYLLNLLNRTIVILLTFHLAKLTFNPMVLAGIRDLSKISYLVLAGIRVFTKISRLVLAGIRDFNKISYLVLAGIRDKIKTT